MSHHVLLVIPCYNESERIGPFLDSLSEAISTDENVAVLVVDDGSGGEEPGKMKSIVEARRPQWPSLRPLLVLPNNVGKGGAVYTGWATDLDATSLAFVDADGSCPAYEVKRLIEQARACPSVAFIASRVCMLGKSIDRTFHRHLIGRVYATIVSEILSLLVYDSQCGLKIIPAQAFNAVRSLIQVPGFAFDVELLCLLLDSGCPVHEVPIDWHETPGGKVHLFRDSMRMFRDVLSIQKRRQSLEWKSVCSARH